LTQRLDHIGLEQRSSRGITFHFAVSESFEFLDYFVKPSGSQTGCTPLASKVLSFTKAFANLSRKLTVVAPTVSDWSVAIDAATISAGLRLATVL
jgi:hypothetical protein